MLVTLDSELCAYTLTPINQRTARRQRRETGEESVLFQTDWDFPGLARSLGWRGKVGRERCPHSFTDGTIDCPECGKTAGQFIGAASEWLDARLGHTFRADVDGYFC